MIEDFLSAKMEVWKRIFKSRKRNHAVDDHAEPFENVYGIGIGEKLTGGSLTGRYAVRVYVRDKIPAKEIKACNLIPDNIDGIPLDVVECGIIRPQGWNMGGSCGQGNSTGTAGCLVVDKDNKRFVLSNNHVIANCNDAKIGSAVKAPGVADGSLFVDAEGGTLHEMVPLDFQEAPNKVDAAICTPDVVPSPAIGVLGVPKGTCFAEENMLVVKHGRTTKKTMGVIEDVSADIWVAYAEGYAQFENTIVIRGIATTPHFSEGGDSGSVIIEPGKMEICGLLFAGSTVFSFANSIQSVCKLLNVQPIVG